MSSVTKILVMAVVALTCLGDATAAAPSAPTRLAIQPLSSLDLSPNGRLLVGVANAAPEGTLQSRKAKAVTIDTACLFTPSPEPPCETVSELKSARARFGYWRPDEQAFVLDDVTPLRINYGARPAAAPSTGATTIAGANKVMLIDPATLPPQSGQAILDSEVRYLSSTGATVLRMIDTNGEARVVWSDGELILPRHLYDVASIMPLRYGIVAKGDGSGFFIWSSSLGRRGQLLEIAKGKPRDVRLPEHLGGPLQLVFPPNGRAAVAAFTNDTLRGLGGRGRAVRYIERYVRHIRNLDPALELRKVSVSDDLKTWALLFSPIEGGAQLHVVLPSRAMARTLTIEPSSSDPQSRPPPVSSSGFVDVTRDNLQLPARLYTTSAPSSRRKLVITFHGGPPLDTTTTEHPWTPFLARLGFDVLDVDYRGSSGYGEAHLLALKAPAAPVLLEDLGTATDWARRQGYAEVGFLGTSAGGLAGVAAASAPSSRLDFIVLESPLIDWPPGAKVPGCERAKGQTTDRIFGLQVLTDGSCMPRSTGALDAGAFATTPVLILQGQRDLRTPAVLADQWAAHARANGACAATIGATNGGHTLANWPRQDQARARQAVTRWIAAIEGHHLCPSAAPSGTE